MTRALLLLTAAVLPLAACGDKDDDTGTAAVEADADTDTDTDADTDADTDTDVVGDMTPGDSLFTATFDSTTYAVTSGFWSGSTSSSIQGDDPDSEVEFSIQLEGNLRSENSLVVKELIWVDTVHNGYDFYYKAQPTGELLFVVDGRDPDGDYIWGSLSDGIEMTDIENGGTIQLESLTMESWPRFGT